MKRVLIIGNNDTCRNANYFNAVEAAEMEPLQCDFAFPLKEISYCDGILIPGGVDLNPALYKKENTDSRNINDELDAIDLQVLNEALSLKKPVLGICRGLQILNVFFGGTLTQNVQHCEIHQSYNEGTCDRVHDTEAVEGLFVRNIYGKKNVPVNSAHHQAVEILGEDLLPAQFSMDGIIEAFVHKTLPIIAVQWHPERMCLSHSRNDTVDGLKIFEYFRSLL